ncbi:MAG TPA: hypothetical protein VD978_34820 [Azospirillum sp.]|nr:hypothetical protein [Azospirillum sp.]
MRIYITLAILGCFLFGSSVTAAMVRHHTDTSYVIGSSSGLMSY